MVLQNIQLKMLLIHRHLTVHITSASRRQGICCDVPQTFNRTTNLQTMTIQVSRANNNGGGNMQGQDGFIVAKEVAGGITMANWPSNNYVN